MRYRDESGRPLRLSPELATTPASKLAAPSLPADTSSLAAIGAGQWFAVHSRVDGGSRDKAVAWGLFLAGVPFYYPQCLRKVEQGCGRWRQRRTVRASLFDGYLFAADEPARKFCFENRDLIEGVIEDPQGDRLRGELLVVEQALTVDPWLSARRRLVAGMKVLVTGGPFAGREALVDSCAHTDDGRRDRHRNRNGNGGGNGAAGGGSKVWIRLETIGQLVPVQVHQGDVEELCRTAPPPLPPAC